MRATCRKAHIEAAIRRTIERFGRIDVLINNAGIIQVGPLDHMQRADFEQSIGLHFWAPYHLTMEVIPHMRKQGGGRIVNISSIGDRVAVPHLSPYCAGKFALTGFSDAIRAELAADNIHITTVAPGLMRTGSHADSYRVYDESDQSVSARTGCCIRRQAATRLGKPFGAAPSSVDDESG